MNERQEGNGELVVSRGDASEVLDAVEKAFDQIAALVEMLVEIPRIEPVGARRYNRFAALSLNQFDEGIRVVSLVGHDMQSRLISAPACSMSATWPAERMTRNGLPKASTATCSLVVSPPRERPIS